MLSRWTWTILGVLVIILGGVVKAHLHFIRVALLALLGLVGLYLIHKLAGDYQKITGGKSFGLFKRSLPDELESMIDRSLHNDHPFNAILAQDPVGCARKMVCTLAAKKPTQLRPEEKAIIDMIKQIKNLTLFIGIHRNFFKFEEKDLVKNDVISTIKLLSKGTINKGIYNNKGTILSVT